MKYCKNLEELKRERNKLSKKLNLDLDITQIKSYNAEESSYIFNNCCFYGSDDIFVINYCDKYFAYFRGRV